MYFKFIIDVALLLAAIAFIIGLRRLSSPDTARKGNLMAAFGMGVAVLAMLIYPLGGDPANNYAWIAGGLVVGSVIGQRAAIKVKLTAMAMSKATAAVVRVMRMRQPILPRLRR